MSGYVNDSNDSKMLWNLHVKPTHQPNYYYGQELGTFQAQNLDFQSFGNVQQEFTGTHDKNLSFDIGHAEFPNVITPNTVHSNVYDDFDELPLLEELEIYPDRIVEKMIAVLNPFRGHSLADDADFLTQGTDLAGPLSFCIVLAISLFVSGSKVYFGYIYGLSLISCLIMYCLLSLMVTSSGVFTLANVSSVLGYSLLPIVGLSVLGVFVSLFNFFGILIAVIAVLWSSLSASRLFVAISGDKDQRPLVAYPCALVCGVFALLVIF